MEPISRPYLIDLFLVRPACSLPLSSFQAVHQSYLVYDWPKPSTGMVSKEGFVIATKRVGFVFTGGELRQLLRHFAAVDDAPGFVAYKKFLEWATPSAPLDGRTGALAAAGGGGMGGVPTAPGAKRTPAMMVKLLETALRRGVDLLAVFGRYDATGVGHITADDFCAALADLGASSVTQREALDIADRFRAAANNFVLYRRIVEELLHLLDEATGAADIDVVDTVRGALAQHRVELRRLKDVFEYYDRKGTGKVRFLRPFGNPPFSLPVTAFSPTTLSLCQVREEDLSTIFEECGARLRRPELEALADRFASGSTGWVQYSALLAAVDARVREATGRRATPHAGRPTGVPDDVVGKVRALIETLMIRGKDYRAEMDVFDSSFTGCIPQGDFRDVMQVCPSPSVRLHPLPLFPSHGPPHLTLPPASPSPTRTTPSPRTASAATSPRKTSRCSRRRTATWKTPAGSTTSVCSTTPTRSTTDGKRSIPPRPSKCGTSPRSSAKRSGALACVCVFARKRVVSSVAHPRWLPSAL